MKRALPGTLLCLEILVAFMALGLRWPDLFWLLVVSLCLYLLFGRRAEVEARLGISGGEGRRVYGALVWRRRAGVAEDVGTDESSGLEMAAARRGE